MTLSILLLFTFLLCGCSSSNDVRDSIEQGEFVYRIHNEVLFTIPPQKIQERTPYPWENSSVGSLPQITKEFFRCKGNSLNPPRTTLIGNTSVRYFDCGGPEKHSLPIRNSKEFIYPILIEILNYLQERTHKRVVITSGHRCPEHNLYIDSSPKNGVSKHLIGAQVTFYVQGLENQPEIVLKWMERFYQEKSRYKGVKEYTSFAQKTTDGRITIQNKEILVSIYGKAEGRDFDNRHPYPYLSVQVRFDTQLQEPVRYQSENAKRNYY